MKKLKELWSGEIFSVERAIPEHFNLKIVLHFIIEKVKQIKIKKVIIFSGKKTVNFLI